MASIEPTDNIIPEFLSLSLQSPSIKKIIEITSHATTIRHISITQIPKWKFGLPSRNEQQKIILILSNVDNLLQNVKIQEEK